MRLLRVLVILALFAVVAYFSYRIFQHSRGPAALDHITVYYTKLDGRTEVPYKVSLGPARDRKSVAFYATAQALAGPPPGTDSIRFPSGTIPRGVDVSGATATVNLGGSATSAVGGSFTESGEFKSLVWTLTALPGISKVQIKINGMLVPTLPGGHFELDRPLARSSW